MAVAEWHYLQAGKKSGPITAAELRGLAQSGRLSADDLIWKQGMGEWKKAGSIKGLFPAAGPQLPARRRETPASKSSASSSKQVWDRSSRRDDVTSCQDDVSVKTAPKKPLWPWLVGIGGGVAVLFVACLGIIGSSGDNGGSSNPSSPAASIDFSKVDYSIPKVDYAKGPQGRQIETRSGVLPDNEFVPPEEAGKLFAESGFRDASGFKLHGPRTLTYPLFQGAKKGDKKFAEEFWNNGKLHGPLAAFDKDGNKRMEKTYLDGIPHGKETIFYADGRKKSETYWFKGKKHGTYKSWWENGTLGEDGAYQDNLQQGRWTFFYENGKKKAENQFAKGVPDGPQIEYHENGSKAKEWTAVKGVATGGFTQFDETGQKSRSGQFVDGRVKSSFVEGNPAANKRQQYINTLLGFAEDTPVTTHQFRGRSYYLIGCNRSLGECQRFFGRLDFADNLDDDPPQHAGGKVVCWTHRCSDGPVTVEAELLSFPDHPEVAPRLLVRRIGLF